MACIRYNDGNHGFSLDSRDERHDGDYGWDTDFFTYWNHCPRISRSLFVFILGFFWFVLVRSRFFLSGQ